MNLRYNLVLKSHFHRIKKHWIGSELKSVDQCNIYVMEQLNF